MKNFIILTISIIFISCNPYRNIHKKYHTIDRKSNRITKKFNYTIPSKSYSDKSTRKRALKVLGNSHHFTY